MSETKNTPEEKPAAPAHAMPDEGPAYALAERVCWHVLEKKGEDVVVLDLRGRSDVCDFFVLATGNSDVQVRAIAKNVQDQLVSAGQKTRGVEGLSEGRWALLDYFDVVVHVFQTEARDYFQIERLWGDAGRLDVGPQWFAGEEVAARHPDLKFIIGTD
jgi:ribosome-associated protein